MRNYTSILLLICLAFGAISSQALTKCKADEKFLHGGCVKQCKEGEVLKNEKCKKVDPSCATKRQCQLEWLAVMKALTPKIDLSKENIRKNETNLNGKRLQAMVPKESLLQMKNKSDSSKNIENKIPVRNKSNKFRRQQNGMLGIV